jgi:hypothetical protein
MGCVKAQNLCGVRGGLAQIGRGLAWDGKQLRLRELLSDLLLGLKYHLLPVLELESSRYWESGAGGEEGGGKRRGKGREDIPD